MLRRGCIGFLLIACAHAAPVPAPPQETATTLEWRAFRNFTSADGLPQNSVLALLQDTDGYIYAGTNFGLARYDGRHWQGIDLPVGERSYAVGALAQTRDGALWIGSDAVGAWRSVAGRAERIALPGESGAINAFWEAPDGRLWIAASDGLFRCSGARCQRIDALADAGARSLFGEGSGAAQRLWVGTNREGVIQLAGIESDIPSRTGVGIARADGLPNNVGLSITRYAGDLWIGSGRGLARYDGERVHVYGADSGFPTAMVFALVPDTDANGESVLLVALRPGGLAEIHPDGRWRLIDTRHGLPSNSVHSLMRERYRDALWLGTMTAGVARVERHRWTAFDERMGLPDRIVVGLGWTGARALWVGTAGGAVRWDAGRFVPLLPPSHATQLVYDLLDAPDGSRWIAHAKGLQRWRGERLELDFNVDNSALPAVSVDRLALRRRADGGSELYVASAHGLARWSAERGLERVRDLPGLASDAGVYGLALLADPALPQADLLWVAADEGLVRLDAHGWSAIEAPCLVGLAPYTIEAEARATGVSLWLAARSGLRRLDADGRCVEYPATRALGALTHARVIGDYIWVFGARGAMRLSRNGAPDQSADIDGAAAGLTSPELSASAIDERGRVFGATAAGLVALQPSAPTERSTPAPLRLTAARWGDTPTPLSAGASLPAEDSSAHFEYSLFAFEREYAVRYRTRLEGLEPAFGAWTTDGAATYARLPPGDYCLHVEAHDADGAPATPLAFRFSVAAHWWQRAWALFAAALLLIASGLGIGRWRLHAAGRRAAALEQEVDVRTRELAAANARLEQAAVTDPLTGLKNRRYFALAASAEFERARRATASRALLIVLLDIDHFKRINDSRGHEAGDAVLVEVARRLQHVARAGDFVLRWGGEEFLLLLRDIAREAAQLPLQRLLSELAHEAVIVGGQRIEVTASIGAICYPRLPDGMADADPEHAIALADAALYRAKREGRDRAMLVEHAGDGDPPCRPIERATRV